MTDTVLLTITIVILIATLATTIFIAIKFSKNKANSGNANKEDLDIITSTLAEAVTLVKGHVTSETASSKTNIVDVFNSVTASSNGNVTAFMNSIKSEVGTIATTTQSQLGEVRKEMKDAVESMRTEMKDGMTAVRSDVTTSLGKVQTDNTEQLEKMRNTVDEKLSATLNVRIKDAFDTIGTRLDAVQKGFGEMQNLSEKVGNLNKVFNNVKTTGNWGEVALETLLNQILAPEQYIRQASIKKNGERVDFAVVMPGGAGKEVLLPIDAKFPTADYERLINAAESESVDEVNASRKSLYACIKTFAKDISSKYIDPPTTTNFAIMYLPTEGLFAEIVRNSSLCNELQNQHKITVCGPTTITALLNSLQIGFTTLKIQKQSGKVVELMRDFKKDFEKFTRLIAKVKNKASQVVGDLDEINKQNDKIQKKLTKVDGFSSIEGTEIQDTVLSIEEDTNEM